MNTSQPLKHIKNSKIKTLYRIFVYSSYLCLDVAFAGVGVGSFFYQFWNSKFPRIGWAVLFLAIYSIYNLDHYLDSRSSSDFSQNPRRKFHKTYQIEILVSVILSSLFCLIMVLVYFPLEFLWLGLGILLFSLLYLFIQGKDWVTKEIAVATLYTAGTLTLPLWGRTMSLEMVDFFLIILFWIAVFLNLISNSVLDYKEDIQEGFHSLATKLGSKILHRIIFILSTIGIFGSFIVYTIIGEAGRLLFDSTVFHWISWIPWVLIFSTPLAFHFRSQDNRNNQYRIWGEMSFASFYLVFGLDFFLQLSKSILK